MATKQKKKTAKKRPVDRLQKLTLTCREWQIVHNLLYSVVSSPKLSSLRVRIGQDNLERVKNAMNAIKVSVADIALLERITIEDTSWVMSRIPWVINEAAGHKVKGLNSDLVNEIYTQLQRNSNG